MSHWIEDTIVCEDCESEVTLYEDGRRGYAVTGFLGIGAIAAGDTDEDSIWRDGHLIAVRCPAFDGDDSGNRCGAILSFTGEGVSIPDKMAAALPLLAHPILDQEPS